MAEIQCKICHKDVTFADDVTVFVCPYCGNWAVVPQITDEETALLHRRAEEFRKNGEFAKSVAVYEQLAHENPPLFFERPCSRHRSLNKKLIFPGS